MNARKRFRATAMRWLKFNFVGGIGILVQLAVLAALTSGMHLSYLGATALAVEAAVIQNFLWHERYTWADRRTGGGWRRFLRFNLTTGVFSIAGNLALMKLLVEVAKLPYLAANGTAIVACSVANFMLSDRFVFRGERPPLTLPVAQVEVVTLPSLAVSRWPLAVGKTRKGSRRELGSGMTQGEWAAQYPGDSPPEPLHHL